MLNTPSTDSKFYLENKVILGYTYWQHGAVSVDNDTKYIVEQVRSKNAFKHKLYTSSSQKHYKRIGMK